MPTLKDCIKDELTLFNEKFLVIRCAFQVQVKEKDND